MDWLDNLVNTAGQVYTAKYQARASAETQPQLGEGGYYVEGKPGVTATPQGFAISGSMLLVVGGALLVVLMMKD